MGEIMRLQVAHEEGRGSRFSEPSPKVKLSLIWLP